MAYTAQYGVAVYGDSKYGLLLLNCSGGSYTITGGNASFLYNQAVQAGAGSYTITGGSAGFVYDQVLQANVGHYALTGNDARLQYDQLINAEGGSYSIAGNSATFLYNQTIYAGAFSFQITGQEAALRKNAKLNANSGIYTIHGGSAGLRHNHVLNCASRNYEYIGYSADLVKGGGVTVIDHSGGLPDKKKKKSRLEVEKERREELQAIVQKEFDILDGTYVPEAVEAVKQKIIPQIQQIDWTEYQIALAQVNELLLKAKIQMAEYESELDDEESLLMLL